MGTAAKEGIQKAGKAVLQQAMVAAVTGTVDDIIQNFAVSLLV